MGGSSGGTTTQIIQPTPPPQPSTADAMREYVASLPALYEAQLKYAPLEAQQQLSLAQQYALPYAQIAQQAQESLYPNTAGLQEQLAAQAKEGISGQVPQAVQDQYRSDLMAQLGENAKSGIGADYVSRNLINQQQQYQQYYQNLGLSLAGRQPLANPTTPNYTNQLGNYQPGQALSFIGGNYGTFANASQPIVTQQQQGTPNWATGLNAFGNVAQGIGKMGVFAGCWVASEIFGSWEHPKTISTRYYIAKIAPKWFRKFYYKFGFRISRAVKNNVLLKLLLLPLFEYFALEGGKHAKDI